MDYRDFITDEQIRRYYEQKQQKEQEEKRKEKEKENFLNKILNIEFDARGLTKELLFSDSTNLSKRINIKISATGKKILLLIAAIYFLLRRK